MKRDLSGLDSDVIKQLVSDLLDQNEATVSLCVNKMVISNRVAEEPSFGRSGNHPVAVLVTSLTDGQKHYVANQLEMLALLCLERAVRFTGDKLDDILSRVKELSNVR